MSFGEITRSTSDKVKISNLIKSAFKLVSFTKTTKEKIYFQARLLALSIDSIMLTRLFISDSMYDILGLKKETDIPSFDLYRSLIVEEDLQFVEEKLQQVMETGNPESLLHRIKKADTGELRHVKAYAKRETSETGFTKIYGIIQDVTEEKNNQTKLEELLREKQILIGEIHHRVKNNMAIVSGLLELQKNNISDEDAVNAMTQSQLRIQTMAEIHEQLYKDENLTNIKSSQYMGELIDRIQEAYGTNNVEVETDIESFELNVNQAVPFGLLLNEVIANVFRHAFPETHQGKLFIKLYLTDEKITASVTDNGVGIPENTDLEEPEMLGYTIIQTLSKQLGAELEIDSDEKGTSVNISFQREALKGSASNIEDDLM